MTSLGTIAQIISPYGPNTPICIDWAHSRIYMGDFNSHLWSFAIPTPLATLQVLNGPTTTPVATWELGYLVVDSTGALFGQGAGFPTTPVYKIDPVAFTSIATFGTQSIFDSYPTTFANPEYAASVTVNNVPYLIVKELNGSAGVVRTDNMTASGYYASVSTGDQGRSSTCAGKSGATGTVFFADKAESGHSTASVYVMTINTGAETYNIASWPTPNPDITSALLATVAATSIDPTWTSIAIQGIGYDVHDDLVLIQTTQISDESVTYLTALNATTGAIVWNNLLSSFSTTEMQLSRMASGQIAMLGGANIATWINGYNGGLSNTINGLGVTGRYNSSDDVTQYIVTQVNYVQDTDTPQPVDGDTPSSFTGYAILGDVWPFNPTPPPPTTEMGLTDLSIVQAWPSSTPDGTSPNGISLRWSDDGGASFSNPVMRSAGNVGDYLTSPTWWRLGMSRNRIFELSWSGALAEALSGAYVRYEISGT